MKMRFIEYTLSPVWCEEHDIQTLSDLKRLANTMPAPVTMQVFAGVWFRIDNEATPYISRYGICSNRRFPDLESDELWDKIFKTARKIAVFYEDIDILARQWLQTAEGRTA